jgi:hypothetical protein
MDSWKIGPGDRSRAASMGGGEPDGRPTTITALGWRGEVPYLLLSGHGAMPWPPGAKVARAHDRERDEPWAWARLDNAHVDHPERGGPITRGKLDGSHDWCVVRATGLPLDSWHPGGQTYDLPTLRTSRVERGEALRHWSRHSDGGMRHGRVVTTGATWRGSLEDGTTLALGPVLTVAPARGQAWFSRRGDSGSLVFDSARRAVGTVVPGGRVGGASRSFVLPLALAADDLAIHGFTFFA